MFFRDTARREAERLGLAGWVRNSPDGAVEAVFEGPSEGVREMVLWCEQGPPDAAVENVDTGYETPRDDLTGFEIR